MKFLWVVLYVLILPMWAFWAVLHATAALITKIIFKFAEIAGDTLDNIEWEIRAIALVKR